MSAACAVVAAVAFIWHYRFVDTQIYHAALRWWADGGSLYEYARPGSGLGFTYPPFAALLMMPFAGLPVGAMAWVSSLVSILALALVLAVVLFPVADRYGWHRGWVLALVLPVTLVMEPVRQTIGLGQVNLVLFALLMADLVAVRRAMRARVRAAAGRSTAMAGDTGLRARWCRGEFAGVGIGLAAAFKLTPALFILYLLVIGERRAARNAILTAVGATLTAALLAPGMTAQYFGEMLWRTDRVGRTDVSENQSLAGLLARLTDTPHAPVVVWVAVVVAVLGLGLARARRAHLAGDELAAFALVGLTANLVSPVSWTHHMLFLLPAVVILADTAWCRRMTGRFAGGRRGADGRPVRGAEVRLAAATVVFLLTLCSPFWLFLHRLPWKSHYADGLFGVVAENSITLLLVALVVGLPRRAGIGSPLPIKAPAVAAQRSTMATTP